MKVIEVIVSPKGETSVQTKGYAGQDCLQASRWLEESLGVAAPLVKTGEFYQAQQEQLRQTTNE